MHGKRRGVWLGITVKVDQVMPGTTAVVEYTGFPKGMMEPGEIEIMEEPDPGPEDREFYWEFRPLPKVKPGQ